jgi:hypothetical protein
LVLHQLHIDVVDAKQQVIAGISTSLLICYPALKNVTGLLMFIAIRHPTTGTI